MKRSNALLGLLLAFCLSSCGGDGPGLADARNGGGTGSTGTTDVVIGATIDDTFREGIVGIGTANLSSGGSTSITVQFRTTDGSAYTESVSVTFSSECQSVGLAEFSETTVATSVGTATTTYSDLGCAGADTITARATIGSDVLTATGALTVAPPTLGSIEFLQADPTAIGLKGTGAAGIKETATLKFRVLNDVGGPMRGETVNFSLSTSAGGLSLASDSAVSGDDGTVSVIVRSGTVPVSVRVTATVAGSNISTQSSALTVSTAIPDANSFSLSAETLNPEAWSIDGVEVPLTVFAADRFNNYVPDDTAIVFTTELGAVVAQCLTVNGGCTAVWRSQDPRIDFGGSANGRTTIIAHAIGEESFEDEDGDGIFDGASDCTVAAPGEECFFDLPEAWRDDDEDNVRDAPNEDFVDFNSNGVHDTEDGEWNGVVCGSGTCSADLVTVSDSLVLVMARSWADVLFFDENGDPYAGVPQLPTTITACIAGAGTFEPAAPATLADFIANGRGQPMPAGTTINFSSTVGEISSSKTSWTVPSTNSDSPNCHTYGIGDTESGEQGAFEVTITSPSGAETFAFVPIEDSLPPP